MIPAATIRDTRTTLGLTQSQLADLLGVHWITVSKWERGQLEPGPYHAGMILKFRDAARTKDIGRKVATALVTAGAIAAVFLLLRAAFKKG
jgi:DNA-binding XRE family transcriptional regulator